MRSVFIVFLCLFFAFPAAAQTPAQSENDAEYLELVKTAHKDLRNFTTLGFLKARALYPYTTFYSPFGAMGYEQDMMRAINAAKTGDKAALDMAKRIADQHFSSYRAHTLLLISGLLTPGEAKFHTDALRGTIMASMVEGDGSSPDMAIKVLDVSEEYIIIRSVKRGQIVQQELVQQNGKPYDLMTYKDEKGVVHKLYFDVSLPFSRYPVPDNSVKKKK